MITATHITQGEDNNKTSTTTASVSPNPNKLQILAVGSNFSSGNGNTPTVSGASMTWVQIGTRLSVSNNTLRETLFRAMKPAPGTGALTIDFSGQSQNIIKWSIEEFDGIDITGADGANAVVQFAGNDSSGVSTGIAVTLAAFSSPVNATYGAVYENGNATFVVGTNFTQLSNSAVTSHTMVTEWANNPQTSVNWTWASASHNPTATAIEIKAAPNTGLLVSEI